MENEQDLDFDQNVEFALADSFVNGDLSWVKDQLLKHGAAMACKLVLGVVIELEQNHNDSDVESFQRFVEGF